MGELQNVGGLQIGQDLDFERRAQKVQRLAWVAIAVGLVAAGVGILGGSGPVMATSRSLDGMTVGYDRISRLGAPMQLDVRLAAGEGMRDVALSRDWLDGFQVDGYVPEPESVTARPDRYVFSFDVEGSGLVRLELTPRQIGVRDAVLWGPGDQRIEFSQLVLP